MVWVSHVGATLDVCWVQCHEGGCSNSNDCSCTAGVIKGALECELCMFLLLCVYLMWDSMMTIAAVRVVKSECVIF